LIKRPLVWILGAYLAGILLAWKAAAIGVIAAIVILAYLTIYGLIYRFDQRLCNRRDYFLWCLPVLLFLGFLSMGERMRPPDLSYAFEQKVSCELSGTIKMIVEKKQGIALYVTDNIITLSENQSYPCNTILIQTSIRNPYRVGNRITASGNLMKFLPAVNPGQFNEKQYYQIEGIDFKLRADQIAITDNSYSVYHNELRKIKSRLINVYSSILDKKEAGTLIAMLLGEKYLLEDEIKRLYQSSGISHILAISGLHVSLLGSGILWFLRKCRLPQFPSTLLTIFLLYSYGELTNFSVSTNRACVMMTILLLAPLLGKSYDLLSATALSALLILLQNPLQLFSAGFLLSYAAVLGIAVLLPCLKQLLSIQQTILNSILVSASATAATTPIILYFFYQFPAYSILVNLLILPFITLLTLTSLLAGLIGAIWLPLGIFFIGGANYLLKLYELICLINDELPGSLITTGRPSSLLICCSVLLLCSFVILSKRYQKKTSLILFVLSIGMLFIPQRNVGLELTMLDVGQGDAIFMETASGSTYLIDGGSSDIKQAGEYRLLPFLKYRGVDRIHYAIITHSDKDHVSGISELIELEQIKVEQLLLPKIARKDENYLALEALAQKRGIKLGYIGAGDRIIDGEIQFFCFHPSSDFNISSSNSYSTVLSVSYRSFDLLLTGDLEKEGERLLTERISQSYYQARYGFPPIRDYDVLKVAHHGSKYSSSEAFLKVIQPKYAIISCGKNNRYGHPHKEVLERLELVGSKPEITYKTGAITIYTDGERMSVDLYLEGYNDK
jgi:competence protein ComEC